MEGDRRPDHGDSAMHRGKAGGGCICLFSRAMREDDERAYRLAACLRAASEKRSVDVHYQL